MKRIFISVGSQGTLALQELIRRLRDENMFDKFNDYYLAFDTDQSKLNEFRSAGFLANTDRIQGYQVEITPEDQNATAFNTTWVWTHIGPGGVGGEREQAKKAAECFRNVWNDPNLGLDSNLQADDHIIVVGSAFGGTSGGMFVNVCQYLDYVIRQKTQADNAYSNVQVLGFLLMPQGAIDPNYPGATNMIDMFRNLQTASWQRRLESSRPGFKVPTLIQYDKNSGYFNLYSGAQGIGSYGIVGSTLPMSALYLVPSPRESVTTDSVYAEALFAASYLRICEGHSRWVDRLKNPLNPVSTHVSAEDNCISGFNMFTMRSGRTRSLKNCFYKEIKAVIQGRNGVPGLCSDYDDEIARNNIVSVFEKSQTPDKEDEYAGLQNNLGTPLYELLTALDTISSLKALKDFKASCQALLNAVAQTAQGYSVLSSEGLIATLGCGKGAWLQQVTFASIREAYKTFYTDVITQAGNLDVYKNKIQNVVDQAYKTAEKRSAKSCLPVKFLEQERAVFDEIKNALKQEFRKTLPLFLYSCRCKNTPFIPADTFRENAARIEAESQTLLRVCEEKLRALASDNNPYIAEGQLDDSLAVLPGVNFNPIAIIFASCYRTVASAAAGNVLADNTLVVNAINRLEGESQWLSNPNNTQIIQQAEEQFIVDFIQEANKLPDGTNPLLNLTFADFDRSKHKTHAPELQVPDSNTFNHHFVIQLGNTPGGFSLTNDDVSNGLGLATMPNTTAGGTQFLSIQHNAVANSRYWSGHTPLDAPKTPRHSGPLFEGKTGDIDIQGLWIGTLGTGFKVKDAIRKIYGGVQGLFPTWSGGAKKLRREMTTVEMLKFGLILEAIGEKFDEAWRARTANPLHQHDTILECNDPLQISFSTPMGTKFTLPSGTPSAIGFEDNRGLVKIQRQWVEEIMKWIRGTNPNCRFSDFFPTIAFASVSTTEGNIFENMRFSITPDETQAMNAAKLIILNSLNVTI